MHINFFRANKLKLIENILNKTIFVQFENILNNTLFVQFMEDRT